MPIFDDDPGCFWATRFGMTPDDWQTARTQAADAAGQAYDADTRAMATSDDAQPSDGAGVDKFQTAYQAGLNQQVAQRAATQLPAPPQMSISDKGLGLIQDYEKYSPKSYVGQDTGNHTIGWGHRLLPGESFPNGIDIESAQKLLRRDVGDAENAVRRHVKVPLNQNQYDALVSLAYNTGAGTFAKSDVVKSLQGADYASAAKQFGSLNHAYDKKLGRYVVSNGLIDRRGREATLFSTQPAP